MGEKKRLSANGLKLIAIAAMTVDHIAWYFVPKASLLGQIMHAIGRLTAPIMCFFIAEGYRHTRSVPRYLGRLALFAAVSHFAYSYFDKGRWLDFSETGVGFSLLCGLAAIAVYESDLHEAVRIVAVPLLMVISEWGDWGFIAVAWCLIFHLYRDDPDHLMRMYTVFSLFIAVLFIMENENLTAGLFHFGTLLALPLLRLYSGKKGALDLKYLFYFYYPLHLIVIAAMWHLS